jgi:hypothetical protein
MPRKTARSSSSTAITTWLGDGSVELLLTRGTRLVEMRRRGVFVKPRAAPQR